MKALFTAILVAVCTVTLVGGSAAVASDSGGGNRKDRNHSDRVDWRGTPRSLNVPRGQFPPPGECKLWYVGRPPGQQPSPVSCNSLRGKYYKGAFVLYGDRAYDLEYNWLEYENRNKGSVPEIILDILKAAIK